MTAARLGLVSAAIGVLLFFVGLYGVGGPESSLYLSALGIVAALVGLVALFRSALVGPRLRPHPAVIDISLLSIAIYAYVHPFTDMAIGWWLWASTLYVLCIIVSCFSSTHTAAIAGAVIALVFDAFIHYTVATSTSSTAAITYIFSPLWNALVFAPIGILVAWFVLRRKRGGVQHAP